eukprot:Gregarina_sp_Pseudo_9__1962@NODE_2354_length_1027_cov_54_321862_g2168_i0_p2_GENE_NODE_2354_length_1027_cov_54_321862_g2168_i0NODE_2354_length_1027_cov_54_321862_g2168_i0_p2_ORF_typecomplete_len213_score22_58Pertussis_S2S3/PF02918_15/0_12_NODE_2354_length_1027_cov_54_321862_g2168_i056694
MGGFAFCVCEGVCGWGCAQRGLLRQHGRGFDYVCAGSGLYEGCGRSGVWAPDRRGPAEQQGSVRDVHHFFGVEVVRLVFDTEAHLCAFQQTGEPRGACVQRQQSLCELPSPARRRRLRVQGVGDERALRGGQPVAVGVGGECGALGSQRPGLGPGRETRRQRGRPSHAGLGQQVRSAPHLPPAKRQPLQLQLAAQQTQLEALRVRQEPRQLR